jgi:hypothetical protein
MPDDHQESSEMRFTPLGHDGLPGHRHLASERSLRKSRDIAREPRTFKNAAQNRPERSFTAPAPYSLI